MESKILEYLRRKAEKAWELAGLARKEKHDDEHQWVTKAMEYEEDIRFQESKLPE